MFLFGLVLAVQERVRMKWRAKTVSAGVDVFNAVSLGKSFIMRQLPPPPPLLPTVAKWLNASFNVQQTLIMLQ